jgi:putrescine aminotransferase
MTAPLPRAPLPRATHNLSTAELRAIDAAHHWHPFSDMGSLNAQGSRIIRRAAGVWLEDSDNNRILDGMSGLWCVNVGYGREEIVEAVAAQMRELPFYNTFFKTTHVPAIELGRLLADVTPAGFNRFFFTGSGSESNDTIIRLVRTYWAAKGWPERTIFISRRNGYHGSTMGGASLGGMGPMHAQGGLPIPGIVHIDQPYWWGEGGEMSREDFGLAAARKLEEAIDRIGPEKIAAFIAEPVQGAGGVIIPPATYWPEVQRILDARGILFISDEVICGFGRLGQWFGHQHFGTRPAIMTLAKGLSSGYLPIGAVAVSDEIAETLYAMGDDFNHGYTYSGHPASCAAAIANLEIIRREGLVERVARDIGPYLQAKWRALAEHPLVGEADMVGLMGGLELTPDKASRRPFPKVGQVGLICRDISFRNNLVMRATRDRMILAPPLVITHAEVDELIRRATATLDETWRVLKAEGLV